jgi:hypothetical protein
LKEFHKNLLDKRKLVERLTKSPPSSGVVPKARVKDAKSLDQRVTMLQSKWNLVWRVSLDHKKKLQDTFGMLLKVCGLSVVDMFLAWLIRVLIVAAINVLH